MHLTAADIANTALLLRDSDDGGIVIVEGPTDSRTLERMLSPRSRRVVAGTKSLVYGAIERINEAAGVGIIGVADRDFDTILGREEHPYVLSWDRRDLEMTVVYSEAFDILMAELCSTEKVTRFVENVGAKSLRDALIERLALLGATRVVSERDGLRLPFRDVPMDRCIDRNTLEVDVGRVIRSCLQMKHDHQRGSGEILELSREVCDSTADKSWLVTGHDVAFLMAAGLAKCLGSHGNRRPSPEVIEAALLSAFSPEMFRRTELFDRLRRWESANEVVLF